MTNTNEITLPWVRIWGPEKTDGAGTGDDARGNYAWQSIYGCGTLRCEMTQYLAVNDMGGEWSDVNPAGVDEMTVYYTVCGLDDEGDEVHNDDHRYEYEGRSFMSYAFPDEAEAAYRELDRLGCEDQAGYFSEFPFDEAQAGADHPSTWSEGERTVMEKRLTSHYQNDRVVA